MKNMKIGKLIDPVWGDNEMKAQWPGERDWTYSREFDVSTDFLDSLGDCPHWGKVIENWINAAFYYGL